MSCAQPIPRAWVRKAKLLDKVDDGGVLLLRRMVSFAERNVDNELNENAGNCMFVSPHKARRKSCVSP